MEKNIFVFGASTTHGYWDIEGGWVARLRKAVDQKVLATNFEFYCSVYELGVSGDDSGDILARFEFEATKRMWPGDEVIFIFSAAINDAIVNIDDGSLKCPPEKYKENVKELIKLAKKYSQKIIFVGTLPVDEEKVDPIPWLEGHAYRNQLIGEYNKTTEDICKENDIPFIKVFEDFIHGDYKKILEDGVHPNTEGHKIVFEKVRDYLIEHQIIDLT
ncbi:MAG: GDSL-type esterase/lipase family protein [Microgenomates group bacterium]|jgi:lysophospholipase L1-like esterase